ncbi:cytochrome P450 [Micromonospora sediminicola]|uniref:cytochrome P450 family protein n=1 Tax=Micromonospora sediminicola TaxID=946078 RepID=UPI00340E4DB4
MTDDLVDGDFLLAGAPQRHAYYRQLRARSVHPVALASGGTAWLITGHDQARQALADPRLRGRTGAVGDRRALPPALQRGMNTHMLNLDPPDHTRLRRLISAAFTRRRINALRPRIQAITDDLLDAIETREQVDLIRTLASPLPIRVLTHLIGVPEDKVEAFHEWTTILTASAVPLQQMTDAADQMLQYSHKLLALKRRHPRPDLLTALVQVRDGDDKLTDDELTSMVFLLLIAGQETTANLIGNGVLALLNHPDQLARLRDAPHLIPTAIEEFLRYESPVQAALRVTKEPIELDGHRIPANAVVIVSLLAANRDPSRVHDADELYLHRTDVPHLAFGHGIHHCLGAPLARLEGAIAIRTLLERFPHLRLAEPAHDLQWRISLVMHGLTNLPVSLT